MKQLQPWILKFIVKDYKLSYSTHEEIILVLTIILSVIAWVFFT